MEEMDTSSYDTWGDIIDEYDLFSVIHNGNALLAPELARA